MTMPTRRFAGLPLLIALLIFDGGVAAAQQQGFEGWDDRRASEILPAKLRSGPAFRVEERVVSDGFQHHYVVDSDYGRFSVQGDAMLRRLVLEIHAIGELKRIGSGEAFAEALGKAAVSPVAAVRRLVTDPVDTVSGVPRGIFSIFHRVGETAETGRSDYDDGALKATLAVSAFKRDYAARLGVDVYTTNKALQTELNRIGWASAIGNLAPSAALSVIGGPVAFGLQQLRHVQQMNELLKELPPAELSRRNRATLAAMGIDAALIERFLEHKVLSPRHKTIIVETMAALSGAAGRETMIELALAADSEVSALFYQQVAETFAGYHRLVSPLRRIAILDGIPIAFATDDALLIAMPMDHGRWTERSAPVARRIVTAHPKHHPVKRIDLWVTGTVSPRAKAEFGKLGIQVAERVNERIGMMD